MNFAVAHFTLFSPTERERLHGHNYRVSACFDASNSEYGITFDYAIYKQKLLALCQRLDSYLLLPGDSPLLHIHVQDPYYRVRFHEDEMLFLQSDTLILPIRNTTLEELSLWFLQQLLEDQATLRTCHIQAITLRVSNGPGRYGSTRWTQTP